MILVIKALFFIHILSLIVGAGANVAMGIVIARLPSTAAEAKPALMGLAKVIGKYAIAGLAGLVGTGIVMAGLGDWSGLINVHSGWFALKLVLVTILVVLNIMRFSAFKLTLKQMAPKRFVMIGRGLIVAIVACSILSFH